MQRGQGGLERPCLYQHRRIQGSECWCFFFPKQKQYMFAKNAKKLTSHYKIVSRISASAAWS